MSDPKKDPASALKRLILRVMRHVDYHALYACSVQGQGSDYLLDLLPDDPKMRGNGYQGVPIRLGLPGARVRVKTGASVLLGFENGSPAQPYAALWGYTGAYELIVQPDQDGEIRLEVTGEGSIHLKSAASIIVESPDVRLGSAAGAKVATEGDLVMIPGTSLSFLFTQVATKATAAADAPNAAIATAFAGYMALPPSAPLAGVVATGSASVVA